MPAAFTLTFQLEYRGAAEHSIYISTGAHNLELTFEPPTTTVEFYTATGKVQYACAQYLNLRANWKLIYDGTLASLYRGDVPVFTNVAPRVKIGSPGIIHVVTYETTTIYLDDLKIEAL